MNANIIPSITAHWFLLMFCKGKGKVQPRADHEGQEGRLRYSFTVSLASALDEGGWSMPLSDGLTPETETRYPLYSRLGGPQGRSGGA